MNDKVYLGIISEKNASQIQIITEVIAAGFRIVIEARQIEHILKRHGVEGISDLSMAKTSDISKMHYTLENPDSIISAGESSAYVYMENEKIVHLILYCTKRVSGKNPIMWYRLLRIQGQKHCTLWRLLLVNVDIEKGHHSSPMRKTLAQRPKPLLWMSLGQP